MSGPMTAAALAEHVSTMRPGAKVTYFTGHLGEACRTSQAIAQLRDMAQRLSTMWMTSPTGSMYAGMGMISLSQRRVEAGFEYRATRLGR